MLLKSINSTPYHGFKNHMPKIICIPLSFAESKKAVGKRKLFKRVLYRKPHKKHEIVSFLGFY